MAALMMWLWNGFNRVLDGSIFVAREPAPPPMDPDHPFVREHIKGHHGKYSTQYQGTSADAPPPYAYAQESEHRAELAQQLRGLVSPALLFLHLSSTPHTDDSAIVQIVDIYCSNQAAEKFEPHDIVDLILKFHISDAAKVCPPPKKKHAHEKRESERSECECVPKRARARATLLLIGLFCFCFWPCYRWTLCMRLFPRAGSAQTLMPRPAEPFSQLWKQT